MREGNKEEEESREDVKIGKKRDNRSREKMK